MAALVTAISGEELRARVVAPAVVVVAGAATFLIASGRLAGPSTVLAALAGLFAAAAAARRPAAATCAALALVIVVPTYWAQPLPYVSLAGTAAALTGAVLVPAAFARRAQLHLTVLDGLVALYFLSALAAAGANVDNETAAIADLLARVVIPYAVFRVLASGDGMPRRLAITTVAVAVPLAFVGVREAGGAGNPFFTLVRPGFEASQWLRSQVRFGEIRAESAFGHAITFSLFLAIALVLVLGLAWTTRGGVRVVLVGVAALAGAALLATISRGGFLSVVVGVAVWAAALRGRRAGLVVVIGVVAAALVLTPAGDEISQLVRSLSDSTEAGDAVRYRLEIAQIVTDPDSFSVLGQEATSNLGVVNAAKELLGLRTIDSQYAVVYVTSGLLGLVLFAAVTIGVIAVVLRRRLDPLERAWAAATAGTSIALGTVALFTQMLSLYWIAVAITAAVASRARD
jgi:hypothetical protein